MRPSGTHLYKRVCPSVRPSVRRYVRPLRKWGTAFLYCFWPRWDPIPKQMINQHVLRASFTTQSFYPSVRPSVSSYMSHDQYTQRHSPDASPGRACIVYPWSFCLLFIHLLIWMPSLDKMRHLTKTFSCHVDTAAILKSHLTPSLHVPLSLCRSVCKSHCLNVSPSACYIVSISVRLHVTSSVPFYTSTRLWNGNLSTLDVLFRLSVSC